MKVTYFFLTLIIASVSVFSQKKKLFNGKDLTGWHNYNKTGAVSDKWVAKDGVLTLTGKGGGDLVTDQEFESFELKYEWKISEGGNSGVMFGVVENSKLGAPYLTGPEMQVLDDAKHPDSFAGKDGNHKAGTLYDMMAPITKDAVKPANEWNKAKMIINHNKNKAVFYLNGKKMADFALKGPEWDALVADSKFKKWEHFGKHPKGKIALQDHGDVVSFKNISIKIIQ